MQPRPGNRADRRRWLQPDHYDAASFGLRVAAYFDGRPRRLKRAEWRRCAQGRRRNEGRRARRRGSPDHWRG